MSNNAKIKPVKPRGFPFPSLLVRVANSGAATARENLSLSGLVGKAVLWPGQNVCFGVQVYSWRKHKKKSSPFASATGIINAKRTTAYRDTFHILQLAVAFTTPPD